MEAPSSQRSDEYSGLPEAVRSTGLQVAIDGPAGAGKSTVGRGLAKVLGCAFVDTGLMYRALTWLALQRGISPSDGDSLAALARSMTFGLQPDEQGTLLVDGRPPEPALRGAAVDAAVSEVSAHAPVRAEMVRRQRELAVGRCIVMVGRDIGTTVLTEAPVKLWVTASAEERARRRREERLSEVGLFGDENILADIRSRDAFDAGRTVSPLRQAEDAVVLETDRLTPAEALEKALGAVSCALIRTRRPESGP